MNEELRKLYAMLLQGARNGPIPERPKDYSEVIRGVTEEDFVKRYSDRAELNSFLDDLNIRYPNFFQGTSPKQLLGHLAPVDNRLTQTRERADAKLQAVSEDPRSKDITFGYAPVASTVVPARQDDVEVKKVLRAMEFAQEFKPGEVTPEEFYAGQFPEKLALANREAALVAKEFQKKYPDGRINPYEVVYGSTGADKKMTADEILQAKSIEGIDDEGLLLAKRTVKQQQLILAEQKRNAANLYDSWMNDYYTEHVTPDIQEALNVVDDVMQKLEAKETVAPTEMDKAVAAQQMLDGLPPETKKAIEAVAKGSLEAQTLRQEIDRQYPELAIVEALNQKIQDKRDARSQVEDAWASGARKVFDAPSALAVWRTLRGAVEIIPKGGEELASTYNAVSAIWSDDAKARLIRRAKRDVLPGTFRDSSKDMRPPLEQTAWLKDKDTGKLYEVGYSNDGKISNIYNENGYQAKMTDAQYRSIFQQAEDSDLFENSKTRVNGSSMFNQVVDGTTDLAITFLLAKGLGSLGKLGKVGKFLEGSGGLASRVRESVPILFQYTGRMAEEGIRQGLSPEAAIVYGGIGSSAEALIESAAPFLGRVTGARRAALRESLQRILANPSELKRLRDGAFREMAVYGSLGDMGEELASAALQPITNRAVNALFDTKALDTSPASWQDYVTSGALGLFVAGAPGVIGGISNARRVASDDFLKESIYTSVLQADKVADIASVFTDPRYAQLSAAIQETQARTIDIIEDKNIPERRKVELIAKTFDVVKREMDLEVAKGTGSQKIVQDDLDQRVTDLNNERASVQMPEEDDRPLKSRVRANQNGRIGAASWTGLRPGDIVGVQKEEITPEGVRFTNELVHAEVEYVDPEGNYVQFKGQGEGGTGFRKEWGTEGGNIFLPEESEEEEGDQQTGVFTEREQAESVNTSQREIQAKREDLERRRKAELAAPAPGTAPESINAKYDQELAAIESVGQVSGQDTGFPEDFDTAYDHVPTNEADAVKALENGEIVFSIGEQNGEPVRLTSPAQFKGMGDLFVAVPKPKESPKVKTRESQPIKGTKKVAEHFNRLVKGIPKEDLNAVLFDWKEAQLDDAGTGLVTEGSKAKLSKKEFLEWLDSDAPFDESVYGAGIREDQEYTDRINKARKAAGFAAEGLAEAKPEVPFNNPGLSTPEATVTTQEGGGPDSFYISTPAGAFISGLIRNADFPGEGKSATRGEAFNLYVEEKRKGTGKSLMLDSLRLMKANGAKTFKATVPSKQGRPFLESLEQQGYIKKIRTDPKSGTAEYEISDKVSEAELISSQPESNKNVPTERSFAPEPEPETVTPEREGDTGGDQTPTAPDNISEVAPGNGPEASVEVRPEEAVEDPNNPILFTRANGDSITYAEVREVEMNTAGKMTVNNLRGSLRLGPVAAKELFDRYTKAKKKLKKLQRATIDAQIVKKNESQNQGQEVRQRESVAGNQKDTGQVKKRFKTVAQKVKYALNLPVGNSLRGMALQYLLDNSIHSDVIKGIFGGRTRSGNKDIKAELRGRLNYTNNATQVRTLEALGDAVWGYFGSPDDVSSVDLRNAVEEVIIDHSKRGDIADEVIDKFSEDTDALSEYDRKLIEEIQDDFRAGAAVLFVDNLTDQEFEALIDDQYDFENSPEYQEWLENEKSTLTEEEKKNLAKSSFGVIEPVPAESTAKVVKIKPAPAPAELLSGLEDKLVKVFKLDKPRAIAASRVIDRLFRVVAERENLPLHVIYQSVNMVEGNLVDAKKLVKLAGLTQENAARIAGAHWVQDGRTIIGAFFNPNITTPLHEIAHVYEKYLTEEEKNTIMRSGGYMTWTPETSEYFARGFERYLAEGVAPSPELQPIFDKLKQFFLDVYRSIVGSAINMQISPEMRQIYARMMGFEIDPTKGPEQRQPILNTPEDIGNFLVGESVPLFQIGEVQPVTWKDLKIRKAKGDRGEMEGVQEVFYGKEKVGEMSFDRGFTNQWQDLSRSGETIGSGYIGIGFNRQEALEYFADKYNSNITPASQTAEPRAAALRDDVKVSKAAGEKGTRNIYVVSILGKKFGEMFFEEALEQWVDRDELGEDRMPIPIGKTRQEAVQYFLNKYNARPREVSSRQLSIFDIPAQATVITGTGSTEEVQFTSNAPNQDYPDPGPETDKNIRTVAHVWSTDKNLQFTGTTKVKNAADVAHIMRLLEDKSVEHGFAVHVDAEGNSYVQYLSIGGIFGTVMDPIMVLAGTQHFKAVKTYLVHNHPSGKPDPSGEDINLTKRIGSMLGSVGVELEHVIMDTYSRQYAVLSNQGRLEKIAERNENQEDNVKIEAHLLDGMEVLREPLEQVTSSQEAARFIYDLRFSALPKAGMIVLNRRNYIIGNYIFQGDFNATEAAKNFSDHATATSVILYGNQPYYTSNAQVIQRAFGDNIKVLDYVNVKGGGEDIQGAYESAVDSGLFFKEVEARYGTNTLTVTPNVVGEKAGPLFGGSQQTDLFGLVNNTEPTLKRDKAEAEALHKMGNFDRGMLAPNGMPSKLTPAQYTQVRTPEFKAWFGDWENDPENASKVVDDNGEPLVVYHGSDEKFETFDHDIGETEAFYFTPDKRYAQNFPVKYKGVKKGKAVLFEVFLNARNIKAESNPINYGTISDFELSADYKEGKYDGVRGIESVNGRPTGPEVFVVFKPTQIKSATDNIGAFDPDNPSILFQNPETTREKILNRLRSVAAAIMGKGIRAEDIYSSKKAEMDAAGVSVDDINAVLLASVRPNRDVPMEETTDVRNSPAGEDILYYNMTTSDETNKMLSGATWQDVFGEMPEGNQMYFVSKLTDMLQDGKNMISIASRQWGSGVLEYGPPLFDFVKKMSGELSNKKAVLLATFLGELQQAKLSNPKKAREIARFENQVFAYYQHYMNIQGKRVAAGRLIRLYRDHFLSEVYEDMILEEKDIKARRAVERALEIPVEDRGNPPSRLTDLEKKRLDDIAQKRSEDDKANKQNKRKSSNTQAQAFAQMKAKEILSKTGLPDMDAFVNRLRNSSKTINCP